jgi:hypothetical protein
VETEVDELLEGLFSEMVLERSLGEELPLL